MRNDLQHPNEYVRGSTLRLVCKISDLELIDPLVPSVKACLSHRHPYVRKNAILAIQTIFNKFEYLIPDAGELVFEFLTEETDSTCKRNAFMVLLNVNFTLALEYFQHFQGSLEQFDQFLQMAILELIKVDIGNESAHPLYISCLTGLLKSSSSAVKFEACNLLLLFSESISIAQEVSASYIEILNTESDNNIKLVVLNCLRSLYTKSSRISDSITIDVLRSLASSDMDVRATCLEIALQTANETNVQDILAILRKELTGTIEFTKDKNYKKLLVNSIHLCSIRFPSTVREISDILLEHLNDSHVPTANDILSFYREILSQHPEERSRIIRSLIQSLSLVQSPQVSRGLIWLIGSFVQDIEEANDFISCLEESLRDHESEREPVSPHYQATPRVLADGTYATESAFDASATVSNSAINENGLRNLLDNGHFFVGAMIATTLLKILSQLAMDKKTCNLLKARSILVLTGIVKLGISDGGSKIDMDTNCYIMSCVNILGHYSSSSDVMSRFLKKSKLQFEQLVLKEIDHIIEKSDLSDSSTHAHEGIHFRLLKPSKQLVDNKFGQSLAAAVGFDDECSREISKLANVVQLTGLSDAVYVETNVSYSQFDILFDILIVNQTSDTLRNLAIDFSVTKGLSITSKPAQVNIGARSFETVKASFKVTSPGDAVIFGCLTFDGKSAIDNFFVVLKEVRIDVLDYLSLHRLTEPEFRSKWISLEWENKITIDCPGKNLNDFIRLAASAMKLECITVAPDSSDSEYLVSNLASVSINGQEILVNACVRLEDERISGHFRIRSHMQGMVFSLGEKLKEFQQTLK